MSAVRTLTCDQVRELAPFYVLGALEPGQVAAIRAHLPTCRDAHREMAELGGAAAYLAQLPAPLDPPDALGQRIMASVRAELRAGQRDQAAVERLVGSLGPQPRPVATAAPAASPVAAIPPSAPAAATQLPTAPEQLAALAATSRRPRIRPIWPVLGVGLLLILGLAGWGISSQSTIARQAARDQTLRSALLAVAQSGATVVHLSGKGSAAGASGFAVMPPDGPAYLVVTGLSTAPPGSAYEAWVGTAGAMRPAGQVTVGDDGVAILTGMHTSGPAIRLVAISLERSGATAGPSGSLLVSGQASP
jgi:Putative zinc-finger